MGSAKDIIVKPISSSDARKIVRAIHYSGKVTQNSQLHLGVFLDGKCGGAMQFGPSLDKRKLQGFIEGTLWNEFIELNRMAFADWLPRNSESRALGYAFRWMRKQYPHIKWCVSFADAAQCGDGTIYRASGFVLTKIGKNTSLWKKDSHVIADVTVKAGAISRHTHTKGGHTSRSNGKASMAAYAAEGYKPIPGFQLRYIYFIDPTARQRLTVPIIPFSEIQRRGAGMYKGKPTSVTSIASDAPANQAGEGGAIPTVTLSE